MTTTKKFGKLLMDTAGTASFLNVDRRANSGMDIAALKTAD